MKNVMKLYTFENDEWNEYAWLSDKFHIEKKISNMK